MLGRHGSAQGNGVRGELTEKRGRRIGVLSRCGQHLDVNMCIADVSIDDVFVLQLGLEPLPVVGEHLAVS
jgi:hypothetical protein